jgi:hypothetical protein
MIITGAANSIKDLPSPALGFLPAVHDASVSLYSGTTIVTGTALVNGTATLIAFGSASPAPALEAGQVVEITNAPLILPPFQSWPSQSVAVGDYAACDGRLWYPVKRYKNTNSFYSKVFERNLYTFSFTGASLPLRTWWQLTRFFSFRLFNNNTDAVWNVVWETGRRVAQTAPTPIGPNLDGYVWNEPMIDEQVPLTDVLSQHEFGVRLYRDLRGDQEYWIGSANRYGKVLALGTASLPTSNDFVLRIRLSCFDTENAVKNPRGHCMYFAGKKEETKSNK